MPRISQLPSLTAADNADELAIVDVSASTTKKITRGDLLKSPLPTNSVTTAAVTNGAITADKLDFTTLNFGNYSTTEKDTGFKWIDGSPIYQKTIDFGSLPNATVKMVNHNIANLKHVVYQGGSTGNTTGNRLPIPYASNSTTNEFAIQLYTSQTQVVITSNSNRSDVTGYVTLLYTKA